MGGSVLVRGPEGVKKCYDMRLKRDEHMSEWMKGCFNGNLDKIKEHLEKEPRLLDRRESLLRMNGLMHVIQGFRQSESVCLEQCREAGYKDMKFSSDNHMDSLRYLLEKGTPVDCKQANEIMCNSCNVQRATIIWTPYLVFRFFPAFLISC